MLIQYCEYQPHSYWIASGWEIELSFYKENDMLLYYDMVAFGSHMVRPWLDLGISKGIRHVCLVFYPGKR